MESDHRRHEEEQMGSGLSRYSSAPSSYFSNFTDNFGDESVEFEPYLHVRASSPETETIIARFMSEETRYDLHTGFMKQEAENSQRQNVYLPFASPSSSSSYVGLVSSRMPQMNVNSGNCSSLARHSSSPAGLFANLDMKKGRLKGQISFSSGPPSSSGPSASHDPERRTYPNVPVGPWNDKCFTGTKRGQEMERSNFPSLDEAEAQPGSRSPVGMSRHSSLPLPRTSVEMTPIERYLQFQDSVPCKIRAKRGCATHPRSIAERVRRTRISERMRKLQELVPNMDKQTSTADMLDLAVDYIKELQKQVKMLSEARAKCTCSSNSGG